MTRSSDGPGENRLLSSGAPSPRRILLVKPSSLGDVIHAFPLVTALKRSFPDASIDWLVNTEFASLVSRHPGVSDVISFPRSLWRKKGFFRAMKEMSRKLRSGRYDLVLDAQGLMRSALLSRLSNGARIIGFSDAREGASFLYHERVDPFGGVFKESDGSPRVLHAVSKNLSLWSHLSGSIPVFDSHPFEICYTDDDKRYLSETLQSIGLSPNLPFVAIHPGAKREIKRWPSLYFSELLGLVRQNLGLNVLLLGSAGEASLLSEIATRSGPGVFISAGDIPLDLIPLCLARARFFVGNDSGPLHMAVMMGTPTYSFFGSSDIRRTGPFVPGSLDAHLSFTDPVPCAPCGDFKTKCSHLSCLVGVTPEVVFREILRMNLGSRDHGRKKSFVQGQ